MQPNIVLYTKGHCPFCHRAKALLKSKNVTFTEFEITDDVALTREMIERSGRKTVPQIFIDDFHVGGASDLFELEATGQLDPRLKIASHA